MGAEDTRHKDRLNTPNLPKKENLRNLRKPALPDASEGLFGLGDFGLRLVPEAGTT